MKREETIREGMSFYKIDNRWFSSFVNRTNENTLGVLALLNLHTNRQGYTVFSINYLLSVFNVSIASRKSVKKIKQSVQFLYETNHFIVRKSYFDSTPIEVDFTKVNVNDTFCIELTPPKKDFTIVYFNELDTILRYDGLEFRYRRNLLRFFCAIVYHINSRTKCSFAGIDTLSKEAHINSRTTCSKYLEILKELGLIISDSASISFSNHGVVYTPRTYYARPEHHKELEIQVKLQYAEFNKKCDKLLKLVNRPDQNKRRSLKQKMNFLEKERAFRDLSPEEEQRYLEFKAEYENMDYKKITKEDLDKELPKDYHVDEKDIPKEDIMDQNSNIIEFPIEDGVRVDINAHRGTAIIERIQQDCDGW